MKTLENGATHRTACTRLKNGVYLKKPANHLWLKWLARVLMLYGKQRFGSNPITLDFNYIVNFQHILDAFLFKFAPNRDNLAAFSIKLLHHHFFYLFT